MSYLDRVERRLAEIEAAHRLRRVESHQPANVIDFSSNDYLALASEPQVVQALKNATQVGSGGARLLGGRHREHSLLEEEIAAWLGRERALLFSSGYLAALGAISVLGGVVDTVYSDELNHASLIDGTHTMRTRRKTYPHGQLPPRSERTSGSLIVTESIFSMDGDCIDVARIVNDLGDQDVLLVDEAHALGVIGMHGAGLAYGIGDPRIVVMGTFSKSLGGLGGFIAGPARLIELLVNTARTFIFDTALPPSIALAGRIAVSIARKADDRRQHLRKIADRLRAGLTDMGIETRSASQIVPIVLGDERSAVEFSRKLLEKRLYAPAVRPPTVPAGTSRLRVSLRSNHSEEHIDILLDGVRKLHGRK